MGMEARVSFFFSLMSGLDDEVYTCAGWAVVRFSVLLLTHSLTFLLRRSFSSINR